MAEAVTLDLTKATDRGRLLGWVDQAPRLMSRADYPDALSDFWKDAIRKLVAACEQSAVTQSVDGMEL